VLPKLPLAVGLLALLFAVGSPFGSPALGAGITPWRVTDSLVWIGVAFACVIVLGCYTLLLLRLGIVPKPAATTAGSVESGEQARDGGRSAADT
jgi:hypothetical protein